jgi:hypothetical protein
MLSAIAIGFFSRPEKSKTAGNKGWGKDWQNRTTFVATHRPLLFKTVKPLGISAASRRVMAV